MHQKTTTASMTFFWGKNRSLSSSDNLDSYILDLVWVFLLSMLVECLSHTRLISSAGFNDVAAGLLQTLMYGARIGVAYLVMLAVMSFNVGALIAAVAGYSVGFLVFGSRVFRKPETAMYGKPTDLPPLSC
ncbi:hypothetical protein U1Q18_041762 [Sarracenia purpurea var. burkii]